LSTIRAKNKTQTKKNKGTCILRPVQTIHFIIHEDNKKKEKEEEEEKKKKKKKKKKKSRSSNLDYVLFRNTFFAIMYMLLAVMFFCCK
jgi:quinol-cytochrome oxidoreductase complex cytochrome b subunit